MDFGTFNKEDSAVEANEKIRMEGQVVGYI